jgi:hypothetical protein
MSSHEEEPAWGAGRFPRTPHRRAARRSVSAESSGRPLISRCADRSAGLPHRAGTEAGAFVVGGQTRSGRRGGPWRAADHLAPNRHPRHGQRLEPVVGSSVPRFWHAARTAAILRTPVGRQAQRPETRPTKPYPAPSQRRDSSHAPTGYSSHVAKSRATGASAREQKTV